MKMAAVSLLLSVALGIVLGMVYDTVRFFRVLFGVDVACPFKKGKRPCAKDILCYITVVLGDLFFFLTSGVLMSVFFFLTGDGRMRAYALFGAFMGFLLYYHTLGRLFIGMVNLMVSLAKRALKRVFKLLSFPLLWLYKLFVNLPIVKAAFSRYNEYVSNLKKQKEIKKRRKRMSKGACFYNGGARNE